MNSLITKLIGKPKPQQQEIKQDDSKENKWKVSEDFLAPVKQVPLWLNIFYRLVGEWPLSGPPPLMESDFKKLFDTQPSFVDYFPVVDYDKENKAFLFDDGINCGLVYKLQATNVEAKSSAFLEKLNTDLATALVQLPQIDDCDNPYIVQLYLSNEEVANLGDLLERKIPAAHRQSKLSQAVVAMMRQHSDMLTNEHGVFEDSRTSTAKGWRINDQNIYMCVYRNLTEKEANEAIKRSKKSLVQIMKQDLTAFISDLQQLGVSVENVDATQLVNWLGPMLSGNLHQPMNDEAMDDYLQLASHDIGQLIISQPTYHKPTDTYDRGIYNFGGKYWRYLTTAGLDATPRDGILTASLRDATDNKKTLASIWEQMPAGSIMNWTIVPEPKKVIDNKINMILAKTNKAGSAEAQYAAEQGVLAKDTIMRGGVRIYYVQIGCFISDSSLENLLDKTFKAANTIEQTKSISVIKPDYDLISQDSFIRNLPFIYNFKHDRKHALRARMTYLTHVSATLPLYGSFRGSANPCYMFYNRSGIPAWLNPFHKNDHERVAHEMIFGPTGSGKSATMVYMALMSMAVNFPRQFILDKGNSFKLLADFYEAMGLKVKRITFNQASDDVFPPFVETKKALLEIDGTLDRNSDDEDERSYISEMMNILTIMITGGRDEEAKKLSQSDKAAIQTALINGLRKADENGDPHARPVDMYHSMLALSKSEENEQIAHKQRVMADSIKLWSDPGPRDKLFNRFGAGLSADYDLTVVEFGNLTNAGNEDQFAVAGLSVLANITAFAEKEQNSGRSNEVILDEGHFWMKLELLIAGMVEGTKVWRKLGTWLKFATQDFDDFKPEAKKILSQAEFWWLLNMDESQAKQIKNFRDLTDEQFSLIKMARKEKGNFTECVMLSQKFNEALFRLVPPSLILALAQTDKSEKDARRQLMEKHDCTELQAAYMISEEIQTNRLSYQKRFEIGE